jgi:protocatechuate 3,4-dioxygenase beta subunit
MKRTFAEDAVKTLILNRREMLALCGATAAAAALAGCAGGAPVSYTQTNVAGCVVSPEQTEGPYFVDEKLNRSDIRTDPSDNSVRPGVPLRLALHVSQIAGNACQPLPGATVDIWHCDASGAYSDVQDNPGEFGDMRGKKFLRGYQVTDADGKVEFQTIYPGWYRGRNVHIHFMIRTDPKSEVGHEFTSQLYFDEAVTDQVHSQAPYAQKGRRDTTNSNDGIYRRGGKDLMLQLTKDGQGYVGAYKVGFLLT